MPQRTVDVSTGKGYALGIFTLKLDFPFSTLKALNEQFYVLGSPTWMFDDGAKPIFSNYYPIEYEKVASQKGKEYWRHNAPFRIPFEFCESIEGDGTAIDAMVNTNLSDDAAKNFRFGIGYTRGNDEKSGVILFQGMSFEEMAGIESKWKKKDKGRKDSRKIYWPALWQPSFPWRIGEAKLWRLPSPILYLDSHLHIQSNLTAPLPLVWDKLPASSLMRLLRPSWGTGSGAKAIKDAGSAVLSWIKGNPLDAFALGGQIIHEFRSGQVNFGLVDVSILLFGESGEIAIGGTDKVGSLLATELKNAANWGIPFYPKPLGKTESVWAAATPLMMDMHFGHFKGYFGEPIYRNDKDGGFSFSLNPFAQARGKISKKEAIEYENWDKQKKLTEKASKLKRWHLLPLFHLDPRRYRNDGKNSPWDEAFKNINTPKTPSKFPSPYIGVKMYTSLGYMPLDPLLPWQEHIYKRCENDQIPIMNHCTVEGMYTHEKPFYYELWDADPTIREKLPRSKQIDSLLNKLKVIIESISISKIEDDGIGIEWARTESELLREKCKWFEEHYVYPSAWQPVINKYKNLKLCLAHFCGYDFWGDSGRESGHTEEKTGMIYGFTPGGKDELPVKEKTNQLIYQLLSLIQPDNQVHADLSFFFFTKHNREAMHAFFKWAKLYKGGFILDRIIWGTDWPLLVTDKMFKLRDEMMRKYVAMNFREISAIDPELWIRFTLINPARFYNVRELSPHIKKFFKSDDSSATVEALFKNAPYTLEELYALKEKAK